MKKFTYWEEFEKYFLELEKQQTKKPFDCPNLIVLLEDVFYKGEEKYKEERNCKPELYRKGSLLCHPRAFASGGNLIRCAIESEIILNETGELEVLCDGRYNVGYLLIKIQGFKKFNPE